MSNTHAPNIHVVHYLLSVCLHHWVTLNAHTPTVFSLAATDMLQMTTQQQCFSIIILNTGSNF